MLMVVHWKETFYRLELVSSRVGCQARESREVKRVWTKRG